jgi:hypothetical protein
MSTLRRTSTDGVHNTGKASLSHNPLHVFWLSRIALFPLDLGYRHCDSVPNGAPSGLLDPCTHTHIAGLQDLRLASNFAVGRRFSPAAQRHHLVAAIQGQLGHRRTHKPRAAQHQKLSFPGVCHTNMGRAGGMRPTKQWRSILQGCSRMECRCASTERQAEQSCQTEAPHCG